MRKSADFVSQQNQPILLSNIEHVLFYKTCYSRRYHV